VMGFMVAAYGLFGMFANLALIVNVLLIISAMSILQATLTLPGIAGIVLTMGMAVDANVLIYERIREEARNGRGPVMAIDAGFRRAFGTILDSNLTTVLAAALLFQFGTGPVRGFAVTLTIGIMASMFTAIMLTRLMVVTWLRQRRPSAVPV
jgi:preprotein translocase subunit SecD